MTLPEPIRSNPATWKDWIAAIGFAITLTAVLVQGGRLLERIDVVAVHVDDISRRVVAVEQAVYLQAGADSVHTEQIATLRRDVDRLQSTVRERVGGGR